MRYTVRLNPRAYNPITRRNEESRRWEVVQEEIKGGTGHDSESVIWHCADVTVNGVPIQTVFGRERGCDGELPKELSFRGVAFRGADNAIAITERTVGYEVR